jgi:hypothetical protein
MKYVRFDINQEFKKAMRGQRGKISAPEAIHSYFWRHHPIVWKYKAVREAFEEALGVYAGSPQRPTRLTAHTQRRPARSRA